MRKITLAVIFCSLVGCSAQKASVIPSPVSDVTWEGSIITKEFSTQHDKMVSDVFDIVKERVTDDYSKLLVKDIISKEISQAGIKNQGENVLYQDGNDCDSKIQYLNSGINTILIPQISSTISYQLKYNTATGTKIKPSIEGNVRRTKVENGLFITQSSTVMTWSWTHNQQVFSESGHVNLNVLASYSCQDNGPLKFKVSVPDYEIKNPTLWLGGQKIAELSVNWNNVRTILENRQKENTIDQFIRYQSDVRTIANKINLQLSSRYKKEPKQMAKKYEHIYKVPHDVMLSRIQRKLETYSYVSDKTRYEFSDKLLLKDGITVDMKTIVRTFPEENGKTSLVINLEYTPIFDNIAKKLSFGEEEAQKYMIKQIELIEAVATNRQVK